MLIRQNKFYWISNRSGVAELIQTVNSADKLRRPRYVAYSGELVLLNKHQTSGGGACPKAQRIFSAYFNSSKFHTDWLASLGWKKSDWFEEWHGFPLKLSLFHSPHVPSTTCLLISYLQTNRDKTKYRMRRITGVRLRSPIGDRNF